MKLQNYNATVTHGAMTTHNEGYNTTVTKEELIHLLKFISNNRWMLQPSEGYDVISKLDFNRFISELIVKKDINISILDITLNNLLLIKKEIEEIILLNDNLFQLNWNLSEVIFTNKEVKYQN